MNSKSNIIFQISKNSEIELIKKKSKFLAFSFLISSEVEAKEILEIFRKKYYDATHICYAYSVQKNELKMKTSDDGEPSGSAGVPMLEVIKKLNIDNVLVIVVRYFGGTLLGFGGLVSAYSNATKEVLEKSNIKQSTLLNIYKLTILYSGFNDVKSILEKQGYIFIGVNYGGNVVSKFGKKIMSGQKNMNETENIKSLLKGYSFELEYLGINYIGE